MLTFNVTLESARKSAKELHKRLKATDCEVKLSYAQESVANVFCHKDWNRLVANIKNNDLQNSPILKERLNTNSISTTSGDVSVTLRLNDKNETGNANISNIYFAIKSFLQMFRKNHNRVYLPDQDSETLSDVEIFYDASGSCNTRWLKLIFGDSGKYVYVKPKELDIFIPATSGKNSPKFPLYRQSDAYTYLRLETDMCADFSNSNSSMPLHSNVVDEVGLTMSDDHYIESLPVYKSADDLIEERHIKKRYNKGTFLIEPFDPYLHETHKIQTFANEHTQNHSMSNADYRNYVNSAYIKYIADLSKNTSASKHTSSNDSNIKWCNTSRYGPIIPLGYRNKLK